MEFYEAIEKRRTVRDFEDKPIEPEIIKRILGAGLKAPTNNHLREWEFVIVNDKKERLKVLNLEVMTSYEECEKMMDGFGMTDTEQRCKRTHGLIICSTWFDFFRQLVL